MSRNLTKRNLTYFSSNFRARASTLCLSFSSSLKGSKKSFFCKETISQNKNSHHIFTDYSTPMNCIPVTTVFQKRQGRIHATSHQRLPQLFKNNFNSCNSSKRNTITHHITRFCRAPNMAKGLQTGMLNLYRHVFQYSWFLLST